MTDQVTFEDLGLSDDILQCLTDKGFKVPTPIQAQTIPLLLNGTKDIIGQAQTGTGKTAAFGLPVIERITPGKRKVQAIVVAPTRELANQVAEELESLKAGRDISILPVYGGQGMDTQLRQLKRGVDIVVATPGRAIDHLNRKTLKLDEVEFVILDEADEMLNMGFIEDIEEILSHCPEERRMLLFSATMPTRIKKLAEKFMGDYDIVKVKTETESADTVEQVYFGVYERDKLRALHRLIDTEPEFYALVFCRTRVGADRLAEKLSGMGLDVAALHGDVSQAQRERILAKFKKGHANILIATDVAARGIDINDLTHVINFDLPDNPESYVHRIGRTGRAGKKGKAISFVAPKDRHKIRQIMQVTKAPIEQMNLPSGQDVVDMKKRTMLERVIAAAEENIPQEFSNLAQELIGSNDPNTMMATLLRMHFGGKLDPNSYPDLNDPNSRSSSPRSSSSSSRDEREGGRRGDRGRGSRGERSFSDRERPERSRPDRARPERERPERSRPERGFQERSPERERPERERPERGRVPFGERREGRPERVPFSSKKEVETTAATTAPAKEQTERKPFAARPEKAGKKKFTKHFGAAKEKFEGVGKTDKPKKKFAKKKAKVKVFG